MFRSTLERNIRVLFSASQRVYEIPIDTDSVKRILAVNFTKDTLRVEVETEKRLEPRIIPIKKISTPDLE